MTAQFSIYQDGVIINQYAEPLTAADVQQMTWRDNEYAAQFGNPIVIIADFSAVKSFPPSLVTLGIRHDGSNPVRNPRFKSVIVITNMALLERMAAVVTTIVKNEKFVVVHDWDGAMRELTKLLIPA